MGSSKDAEEEQSAPSGNLPHGAGELVDLVIRVPAWLFQANAGAVLYARFRRR
jgi:hypothetical protein